MILAIDTYYFEDKANTAYVLFNDWTDEKAETSGSFIMEGIAEYESGEFYKRELPCILDAYRQLDHHDISCFLIDGYVLLDDYGKKGLGGYLYEALNCEIPVIGVAKNAFKTDSENRQAINRGSSQKPLYITSLGWPVEQAAIWVESMYGPYRIPALLRLVDQLSRTISRHN